MQIASPPPAPPLPPPTIQPTQQPSISYKFRTNAPSFTANSTLSTHRDRSPPPTGIYFFYGSLQDPSVLSDILSLTAPPTLQPAQLLGFKARMWGHYPAVVRDIDSDAHTSLKGHAFEVADEVSAAKLATYETNSYRPVPCAIKIDGQEAEVNGFVFEFCGNEADLSDGTFDLATWRRLNGRRYGNA